MGKVSPNTETATPGVGDAEGAAHLEEVRKAARKARRTVDSAIGAAHERRLEEEIEALYEAGQWEEIAALYFNVRYATTGFQGFILEEKQQKRLGASLALMMKILVQIDPKYLAVIVFSVNFGTIISEKEAKWYMQKKAEKKSSDDGQ